MYTSWGEEKDVRGIRARTLGYLKNPEYVDGACYVCDNTELLDIAHPQEVDMVFHINWCNPRYLIGSIEKTPDDRVKITPNAHFSKHKGRIDFAGASRLDSTPGYLENAYEFLDQPREWYLNPHDGYLYYIPDCDEDIENMTVKIPTGERLIDACGKNAQHTVSNIVFDNICFEGTTWLKVDRDGGFHDAQNGHIREKGGRMTDAAPGAAVHFEHCRNIKMTNNIFRQMGITGVEFMIGSKYVDFIGNEMYDISGVAVTVDDVGLTGYPDMRSEESYCEYVKVNNNYIRNVGRDYKSSAAVSFAWPRHSQFNHNEICAVPYSGFHGLYGWEEYAQTGSVCFDTEINYNYVHDVFTDRVYDGGCIYTLGASSLECEKTNIKKNNRIVRKYTMPVRIITHSSPERAKLTARSVDLTSSWKNPGEKTADGGLRVAGSPNHHGEKFKDELITFDMLINPGNTWPSLAICDSDQMGDYRDNDCYMFTFKEDFVGLQRFNEGKRTVIFDGSIDRPCGVSGCGAPHNGIFQYNKRHKVTIGALDTEDGTRLVLNIDGINIIDYTDNDLSKLPAFGLLVVYNPDIDGTGTTFWSK